MVGVWVLVGVTVGVTVGVAVFVGVTVGVGVGQTPLKLKNIHSLQSISRINMLK
jgi:hypothetical protein